MSSKPIAELSKEASFFVVEFEHSEVGIVSSKWLTPTKKHAWWPAFKDSGKLNKAVQDHATPDEKKMWTKHSVICLFHETSTYSSAREKCRASESKSDVNTDQENEQARLRKNPRRKIHYDLVDSETDCDETYIDCSTKKKKSSEETRKFNLPNPPEVSKLKVGNLLQSAAIVGSTPDMYHSLQFSRSVDSPSISCSPINDSDHLFKQKTLEMLSLMNEKISRMARTQDQILQALQTSGKADVEAYEIEFPSLLPLSKLDDVKVMEDFLATSGNVLPTVLKFSKIGGKDVVNATNRILANIFTNEVASQFNYKGSKDKQASGGLRLKDTIIRAVRKTFPEAKDSTIETTIKCWLKHSSERMKKKSTPTAILT